MVPGPQAEPIRRNQNRMGNSHPAYRKDIDGIRAVAILLVVAFHAFPSTLPGGFVGVDVFFVISGFLITGIILRNLQDGNFSFSDFYARRTRRIFPALFLILAASFVIGWYVLLPDEYLQLGKHIAAGSGFVQNFVLWQETGYFDRDSELKPLMHLWSLAVEEQFYLVFPLLMWALWRAKESILSPILVIGLFSFALNVAGIERDGAATFFLLHTRLWELVAGSLLACLMLQRERPILLEKVTSSLAGRRDLISACGLSLIVVSAVAIRSESAFPGWLALLPVCGTFMMILTGPETIVSRRFLAAKSMVLIGLISYPLYLWHWLLLSYHRIVYPHEDSTLRITGVVLASALLAWLTYRFVERPVRFASRGNGASIAVAAAVASMGAVGYLTYTAGGFENRFRLHHVRAGEFQYDTHWEGWSECSNISAPDPKMGGCRILHPGAPARIAVIGDSHAGHLASGLGISSAAAKTTFSSCCTQVAIHFILCRSSTGTTSCARRIS